MTLDNKEKTVKMLLASALKVNYKGVNEVDSNTGYVEEKIEKIFEKVKLANIDLKNEDRYSSCFITNRNVFPYSNLVKEHMTTLDIYTVIINLAVHCILRDTATNIISLSSILNLKELYSMVSILYKSTNIRTICKNHTSEYLFVNRIDFSNSDDENEDVITRLKKSNERDLLNFDTITVLDSNGIKNGGILDTIMDVDSNMMKWPNANLYQNLLPFLNELKGFVEEEQEKVITFFSIPGRTLSNGEEEMIYSGYIPLEKYPLSTEELHSKEQLDKEEHKKLDIKFQELYDTYDYLMRDLFHKAGKQNEAKKEGTINANEMTSILSCNPPNSLAYSFNNPPKYSTIVFSPDYKISEILEVKDINKQAEAEYLENKNIICVYNDKKEKHNSYEATLNIDIENDSSKANGHGRIDFHITGYGVDKEEAIGNLNIIYIDIMNKFYELKK